MFFHLSSLIDYCCIFFLLQPNKTGTYTGLPNTCQVLSSPRRNVSRSTWNLGAASTQQCAAEQSQGVSGGRDPLRGWFSFPETEPHVSVPGKWEVIMRGHALEVRVISLRPNTHTHAQLLVFNSLGFLKLIWLFHLNIPA